MLKSRLVKGQLSCTVHAQSDTLWGKTQVDAGRTMLRLDNNIINTNFTQAQTNTHERVIGQMDKQTES